jgi:hypothetical protein
VVLRIDREGDSMATNEGRRWTMDDAWWMDPPTLNEPNPQRFEDGEAAEAGEAGESQTLWADDAGAWNEEPLTSPDVGEDEAGGIVRPPPPLPGAESAAATQRDPDIDPLWAYF